jgi:septal ring factor EnvC (AmiA/AmiB activator)
MLSSRLRKTACLSSLILLTLSSCSGTASQCNQLISAINRSESFVSDYEASINQSLTKISGAQNLEDIKSAANTYISAVSEAGDQTNALAQDLQDLDLNDEQLSGYRAQYARLLAESAAALTTAQSAMQLIADAETEADFSASFDTFQKQTNAAYETLQSNDTTGSTTIEEINAYCAPQ